MCVCMLCYVVNIYHHYKRLRQKYRHLIFCFFGFLAFFAFVYNNKRFSEIYALSFGACHFLPLLLVLFEVLLSATGFDDGEEDGKALAGDLVALVELAIGGFEFGFELPTVFIGDELLLLIVLLILLPLLDCD